MKNYKIFNNEKKLISYIEEQFNYSDMVEYFEDWCDECTFKEFLAGEHELDYTYFEFLIDIMSDIKGVECITRKGVESLTSDFKNNVFNFAGNSYKISNSNLEKYLNYEYYTWYEKNGKIIINKE